MIIETLAVAAAGGLGAVTRFVLDSLISARVQTVLPVGTMIINVSGSLMLGLLAGMATGILPDQVAAITGAGFLGGYTTFSAVCLETVRLLQQRQLAAATATALGTLVLTTTAAILGLTIGIAVS